MVETLIKSLKEARGAGAVSLEVGGDDFEVQLDHAASFALIVHEVLASAIRSAAARPNQALTVTLLREGARRSVTVAGPGFGPPGGPEGVGKTLVRALAVQLNAIVDWDYRADGGRFRMDFEENPSYPTRVVTRQTAGGPYT